MKAVLPKNADVVTIRRARVSSVDFFEVKDSELDQLEKGSGASLQLTFGASLLSLAFSSIITLSTTEKFYFELMKNILVVTAVVGVLLGGYLLGSWWLIRKSNRTLVTVIRSRMETVAVGDSCKNPSVEEPSN